MFDDCLIERYFVDVGEGNGSSPQHCLLDDLGARVVAGLLNLPLPRVKWSKEMNEASLPYLRHIVEYNGYYVAMVEEAREMGHDVPVFMAEHMCYSPFNYRGTNYICNPDAYFEYWRGDEGLNVFLEWDRDTVAPKVFQEKQGRYRAFYASGEFERRGYEIFPAIVTIAPTWERCERLRRVIEEVDRTDLRWLFATPDQLPDHGDFLEAHKKAPTRLFE